MAVWPISVPAMAVNAAIATIAVMAVPAMAVGRQQLLHPHPGPGCYYTTKYSLTKISSLSQIGNLYLPFIY